MKFQSMSNNKTFGVYIEQWLESVKFRCKRSTYNKYKNICKNHIVPFLANIKVHELNVSAVNTLLSSKSKLAPKTLNDMLCVVKMIYSYAIECGCSFNSNISSLSVRIPKKQMRVLTVNEQKKLIDYLFKNMNLYSLGIYLAICTGIRIGELCALKRKSISFEENTIYIGETMQRIQTFNEKEKTEVITTEPKSKCSLRKIPISGNLLELMRNYYYNLPETAYLLSGRSDKFIEPAMMRYHFKKLMKACEFNDVKFHTLRHSFATRCIELGMDVRTLSEILGHENVNITLNRYVHSSMELKRENMNKIYCSLVYSP